MSQIIKETQLKKKKIISEHKKLYNFYMNNPMAFYSIIEMNIDELENLPNKSESELKRLSTLKKIISENNCIEKNFSYKEIYLFDSYKPIYCQIKDITPNFNDLVILHFYSLTEKSKVPIGEMNEYGKINTGSQLIMDTITVDAELFYYFYKMQLN